MEPPHDVDLLLDVALAGQLTEWLDGTGLDRREPMELERVPDNVKNSVLDDSAGWQELRETAQRLGGATSDPSQVSGLQVRVGGQLLLQRRGLAVPRQERGLGREARGDALQRIAHLGHATAGQIRPPDRARERHVPAEDDAHLTRGDHQQRGAGVWPGAAKGRTVTPATVHPPC